MIERKDKNIINKYFLLPFQAELNTKLVELILSEVEIKLAFNDLGAKYCEIFVVIFVYTFTAELSSSGFEISLLTVKWNLKTSTV